MYLRVVPNRLGDVCRSDGPPLRGNDPVPLDSAGRRAAVNQRWSLRERASRAVCIACVLGAAGCRAGDRAPSDQTLNTSLLTSIGREEVSERGDRLQVLEAPAYLRLQGGSVWTLDTGRRQAVRYGLPAGEGQAIGTRGRGPGELAVTLAFDLAPDGTAWIADVGNAKVVGLRDDLVVAEFPLDHPPAGLAAPDDSTIWVAGDLQHSLFHLYDRAGQRLRSVGVPADTGALAFRLNQGVAATGTGACHVVWVYTFRSIMECYDASGDLLWTRAGPDEVVPRPDADPTRSSARDVFAYTDVAAAGGRIYALFVGAAGAGETDRVHVFDATDGTFLGVQRLPGDAMFFTQTDSSLATLDYDPFPRIHVFRIGNGP